MSTISIIIPVYNAASNLDKLVNSVISQTFKSWELILVNDGSTDKTLQLLEQYAKIDDRIKIFTQDNKGPSAARNLGIKNVSGTYLTFIDADDEVKTNYLEQLIKPIQENENIDLVCAGYYELNEFYPAGIPLHDFADSMNEKTIHRETFLKNIFKGLTGVLWAKLFKTSIIKEKQIQMPENLKLSEDLIFVIRYAKNIEKIALVFENIYYYNRLSDIGITRKLDKSFINNILDFNNLVLAEFFLEKETLQKQLKSRTVHLLVKMLKDQATSPENLKLHQLLIDQKFDAAILQVPLPKTDKIFIKLIQRKYYVFAIWQLKFINYLRKIKHAQKDLT